MNKKTHSFKCYLGYHYTLAMEGVHRYFDGEKRYILSQCRCYDHIYKHIPLSFNVIITEKQGVLCGYTSHIAYILRKGTDPTVLSLLMVK